MKLRNPFKRSKPEPPQPLRDGAGKFISKQASEKLSAAIAEMEAPATPKAQAVPTSTHKTPPAEILQGPPAKKEIRGGVFHAKQKKYEPLARGRKRGGMIRTMPRDLREVRRKQENVENNTDD